MNKKELLIRNILIGICVALIAACGGAGNDSSSAAPKGYQPYYVYTVNKGSNDVSEFASDSKGDLTFYGRIAAGNGPVACTGTGNDFFVANAGDNTITQYSIDQIGRLSKVLTFPTGNNPNSLAEVHFGPLFQLYVTCSGSNQLIIYNLSVSASPVVAATLPTGAGPAAVDSVHGIVANYQANDLTLIDSSNAGYSVSKKGLKTGQGPSNILDELSDKDLNDDVDVLNTIDGSISEYSVPAGGAIEALNPIGTAKTGPIPIAMTQVLARGKTGDHLLYTLNTGNSTIGLLTWDYSTGLLKSTTISSPSGVGALDIKATYEYSTDTNVLYEADSAGVVNGYYVNADNSLKPFGTFPTSGTGTTALYVTGAIGAPESYGPISISDKSYPNGVVGTSYYTYLDVAGGILNPVGGGNATEAVWSVASGALPDGLAISYVADSGEIVGTPTKVGTFTFTLKALQNSMVATKQFTITVTKSGGGGGGGPFVEVMSGATDYTSIDVSEQNSSVNYASGLKLGTVSAPFNAAGETSATVQAVSSGKLITYNKETYTAGNRYLLMVEEDPYGSTIGSYTYQGNTYPPAGTEWIVFFNGVPDFISPLDFYVLGPGQTTQNTSPSVTIPNPGPGAKVSIPSTIGKFQVAVTQAGDKAAFATSPVQTSASGVSLIADMANGAGGYYDFLIAQEQQPGVPQRGTGNTASPKRSGRSMKSFRK